MSNQNCSPQGIFWALLQGTGISLKNGALIIKSKCVEGGTGKTTKGNATASPCGMRARSSPGQTLHKAPSKSISALCKRLEWGILLTQVHHRRQIPLLSHKPFAPVAPEGPPVTTSLPQQRCKLVTYTILNLHTFKQPPMTLHSSNALCRD